MLRLGADATYEDWYGKTALSIAAYKGNADIAARLIRHSGEHGLNLVNQQSKTGVTALTSTIHSGSTARTAIFGQLLDAGAHLSTDVFQPGLTILHVAARHHGSQEDIRIIVEEAGKSMLHARTLFHNATPLLNAVQEGSFENVEMLLELGSDISARNCQQRTALMIAAAAESMEGQHSKVLEFLLEKDGDLEARDVEGRTALHIVALGGFERRLKVALSRCKAHHLKLLDNLGFTVLHQAVQSQDLECIELVIAAYAEFNLQEMLFWRRKDGLTALDMTITTSNEPNWTFLSAWEKDFKEELEKGSGGAKDNIGTGKDVLIDLGEYVA